MSPHIARHNLTAAEIEEVFATDPIEVDFSVINSEHRWTALGHTNRLDIILVVYTMRQGAVRPITARVASATLRNSYLALRGETQ